MPDTQILASGSAGAPEAYTVPPSQEIIVKAASCTMDGTGASGDFLPMLSIIPPGGVGAIECPMLTSVAAGASAEVSWFPGGLAQTPPSTDVPQTVYRLSWNVGAGLSTVEPPSGAVDFVSPETFYPDVYDIDDDGLTAQPEILEDGFYWWDALWFAWTDDTEETPSPIPTDLSVDFGGGQFMGGGSLGVPLTFPTAGNNLGAACGVFNTNNGPDLALDANNVGGSDIWIAMTLRVAQLDRNPGVS